MTKIVSGSTGTRKKLAYNAANHSGNQRNLNLLPVHHTLQNRPTRRHLIFPDDDAITRSQLIRPAHLALEAFTLVVHLYTHTHLQQIMHQAKGEGALP